MNIQSPKISVIVPVYKAETYLHRCINSILAQTFTDFEVLLIDDGSPDRSGEICDEFAQKDKRVRVFHKENGGVSSARQCGIDNAYGEYTIHVDPDDWVEICMLEELYTKAVKDDADMVICDYFVNKATKQIYQKQQPSLLDHETVLKELFQQLHGSCCNKLIKRTCYINHNIKFCPDLNCREDLLFNVLLLVFNIKIAYIPQAYYHYDNYSNANSLVKNKSFSQDEIFLSEIQKSLPKHLFNCVYPYISYQILMDRCLRETCSRKEFKQAYKQYLSPMFHAIKRPLFVRIILALSLWTSYSISRRIILSLKKIHQ